ncbi:hypothetical protein AVEN_274963-1 [Araneus ventricosus]|uniref:Uncharacterized protein n=1 Tax=Araneus ventricosus TaxID=182803 RepID=A0A4Y2QP97_ARAVE|nr:hypothetical protein AVEN_274963-1 [Araneus ventricosus]
MPHPSILCLSGMLVSPLSYSSQSSTTCYVSQHLLAAIPAQLWIGMDEYLPDSFRIVQTRLFEKSKKHIENVSWRNVFSILFENGGVEAGDPS